MTSFLQIFASVGCTQAFIGEINPTYNLLFKETLDWFPQFCYIFSCVILLVMVFILLYCIWFWKKLLARQAEREKELEVQYPAKDVADNDVNHDTTSDTSDSDSYDEFDAKTFEFAKKIRSYSIWSASEVRVKL